MIKLSDALTGKKFRIKKIEEGDIKNKLMELCFMPNEVISVEKTAPLGDPLYLKICNYNICLRLEEAENIWVEEVHNE